MKLVKVSSFHNILFKVTKHFVEIHLTRFFILTAANAFRSNASTMAAMEMFEEHEGTHILQSLDGFAISLNSDGRFLYISETVSIYLGLSQVSKFSYRDVIYR